MSDKMRNFTFSNMSLIDFPIQYVLFDTVIAERLVSLFIFTTFINGCYRLEMPTGNDLLPFSDTLLSFDKKSIQNHD